VKIQLGNSGGYSLEFRDFGLNSTIEDEYHIAASLGKLVKILKEKLPEQVEEKLD
jgi:hypothetical protein